MSCSYENCSHKAIFFCSCKVIKVQYCTSHSSIHCASEGTHKLSKIFKTLDPAESVTIKGSIAEYYLILQNLRISLMSFSSQIISKVNSGLENALNPINLLQKLLVTTLKDIQDCNEIHEELYKRFSMTYDLKYFLDTKPLDPLPILNPIEDFYSTKFIDCINVIHKDSVDSVLKMLFFTKNTKKLNTLDIKTLKMTSVELNLPNRIGSSAGWCQLPGKKVFHYGGQKSFFLKPSDGCCIIDSESQLVEFKQRGPIKLYSIGLCSYYENSVYMFGGLSNFSFTSDQALKFNLESNAWSFISSLPAASSHTCSVVLGQYIYITGASLGLYLYDPLSNKYHWKTAPEEGFKILIPGDNSIFWFCDRKIIEENLDSRIYISSNSLLPTDHFLKTYPVKHILYVYFLSKHRRLFRINVKTKVLEAIDYNYF